MTARLPIAAAATAALLAAALVAPPAPAQAQTGGFHISGTDLVDANGNPFVIRGTALPHVWFPQQFQMFGDAAGLGANTVRVVLGSGHQWGPSSPPDVANVVDECRQLSLVCMLEVHDATGFGEQSAAVSINQVVDEFWSDPALVSVLQGQEAFVLINIANEPRGNSNAAAWVSETITAIQDMRAAGYDHTLVVDAPNWGQDWQFVMRDNAPQIAAADPQGNLLFSIHMYEVFGSASSIINYLNAFQQAGLPLMVGEFGHLHNGQNVDEDTIMAEAQARGIGWIAWSWSGNSGGVEFLDQVSNFNPGSLTQWGQRVFQGANGIGQTAQCATVYPDCGDSDPPPPPPPPPPPGGCQVGYQASDWGGHPGFTATVTVTNPGGTSITGWTVGFSYPAGQDVEEPGWNATVAQNGPAVTAVNAAWNGTLAPGQSTSFGFNGLATAIGNNPPPTGLACTTS